MEIDEDLTLRKIQIFLAFMRYGNLSKTAAEMQISNVSVHACDVLYSKMKDGI